MVRRLCAWFAAAIVIVTAFDLATSAARADKNALLYVGNLRDNTVSVIDTNTNTIVTTIPVGSEVFGGAVSPDGGTIYVAGGLTVSVIDAATNSVTKTIALHSTASDMALSPDGSKLYITSATVTLPSPSNPNPTFTLLAVIDTSTGTIVATPATDNFFIFHVLVSPDESKAYLAEGDRVEVLDTRTNTVTATIMNVKGATASAITPDGSKLYVTGNSTFGIVSVISTATNTVTGTIPVGNDPLGIGITPDGSKVYVANEGSDTGTTVSVIATATDTVSATISGFAAPQDVAISPSSTFAYVNNKEADTVSVIDTGTNTIVKTITGLNLPFEFSIFTGPARDKLLGAAVLPASRSVQVGSVATLFGTIINSGPGTASNCRIAPTTSVPATFSYQTTDPATNGLTGTANTPVSIPQGGAQSFLLALTPSGPFNPTDVAFGFSCSNAVAAASYSGINTLLLSASTTPVPDIVAIGLTATKDGTLHIAGTNGSGALAVAIANVGSSAQITAMPDTGAATLPLTLSICQTNQSTGACLSPPSPSVLAQVSGNATASFGIFASAHAAVPFSPAVNRIFVRFVDSGGVTRGSTSVAVQTQ